ncbi:MAG: lytic transglycosylase domain-containing protein, partial [Pseudomonadota bacterium]
RNKKVVREALVAFAHHYKLAGLSYKIGYAFQPDNNQFYDAALYPEKAWNPDNGYKVDRALINAIIRQESRFQSGAKNASGATGLMQLMPRTAKYIANKNGGELTGQLNRLHEPMVNIAFGQNYIHYLLNHRAVGQDLMAMAIAYNAGPGTLSKWKREYSHIDDPLLFIEVIPFHETRAFVERVMANFWLYRMRYDQKLHSLDDVAEGRWARYISQDSGLVDVALR